MNGPDATQPGLNNQPTMPTPESPAPQMPNPTLESPTPAPIQGEAQSYAAEQHAYDEDRAKDPVVQDAMNYLTDLSKVAKGEEFVKLAGGALRFAEEYARAKNGNNH